MRILPRFALLSLLATSSAVAQSGIGTCVMGETRGATSGLGGELEYGLVVHQWMDPATCGFCLLSQGAIELRTVELDVFMFMTTPLEVPATVSVIGWTGSPECPVPDESAVLVPPRAVTFTVSPTGFGGHVLARAPFGPSPAFVSPAFLKLEFPVAPAGTIPISLGRHVSLDCGTPCRQYQTSPLGYRNLADACGEPVHYPYVVRPRGDCVAVVSARRASWSGVKSFYR